MANKIIRNATKELKKILNSSASNAEGLTEENLKKMQAYLSMYGKETTKALLIKAYGEDIWNKSFWRTMYMCLKDDGSMFLPGWDIEFTKGDLKKIIA